MMSLKMPGQEDHYDDAAGFERTRLQRLDFGCARVCKSLPSLPGVTNIQERLEDALNHAAAAFGVGVLVRRRRPVIQERIRHRRAGPDSAKTSDPFQTTVLQEGSKIM